jgi:hypothetical protein
MSDDLVLDAPVLEDTVDEPIQGDPIESESAEDRPEEEIAAPTEGNEPAGDGRKLPQWIRDLKTAHPAAYKEAKGIFFGKDALDAKLKDFDLDGIKGWLEEKGGRESLESAFSELETKASELDGINEAIAAGSPELIKEIAELHPESFGKLAEATINQWAQTHPDDYGRVMSGVMANTIQSSGVPMFLERMALYLEAGKGPEVAQMIQKLQEWSGSFGQAAKAPTTTAHPKNDVVSQREQTLAQRERQIYNENYMGKLESQRKPMIEEALKDYIAQRPDSPGTKDRAIKAAIESIEATLGKDQAFVRSVQAFHAKGDAEGALRLVKSREARVVAEIAKTVGEDFYGKLGPKVVAKPAVKPGQQQQRKPSPQTPGKPKDKFAEIFASA